MAPGREKVIVAMSGGVDSSVAACLLVQQGYDVMGLFMRVGVEEQPPRRAADFSPRGSTEDSDRLQRAADVSPRGSTEDSDRLQRAADVSPRGSTEDSDRLQRAADVSPRGGPAGPGHAAPRGCCSASDAADARFVAGMLDIPFHAVNFREDFEWIIDNFVDEYVRGRTPNPCIHCNDRLKFGKLLDYADSVGARYVATGHYARIGERNGHALLMRARDLRKDQSYVLFGVDRNVLGRVLFPLGERTKSNVRDLARRFAFPNRGKPESMEICFAPDRDYASIVRERRPDAFVEGDVIDADGNVIGRHCGIGHFTIGQRRGLGIAAGKPIYVTALSAQENTVTMGDRDALLKPALVADHARYLADAEQSKPFRANVKIRYLHPGAPATVYPLDESRVRVVFDEPQRAITPGQAAVFYDGDVVLGGAWIDRAEETAPPVEKV